jgi:hypothetical protein
MLQQASQRDDPDQWGVICLHCGTRVPFRSLAKGARSIGSGRSSGHLLLVWCRVCEREGPYLMEQVVHLPGPRPARIFREDEQCSGIG